MANSQTEIILELSEFLPNLKTMMRRFQSIGKITALLNKTLEMIDLKIIHMMTICRTRMSLYLHLNRKLVI